MKPLDENQKQDMEQVEKALATLAEHFDTVQIFCTRHEAAKRDGTLNLSMGRGNWFARFGHVQSWIETQKEGSRNEVARRVEMEEV